MGFKLKSGNATSFKNMGSSPVKQSIDPDGSAVGFKYPLPNQEKEKSKGRMQGP